MRLQLHPDKVFLSAKADAPELGFTDAHQPEVGAKHTLVRSGGSAIALLDASKFGRRALATIATIDQVRPPAETRAALDAADIKLLVAR